MGLLTRALRFAHPIRSAKRSVRRAIIPRPIRQALSVKNAIAHPLSALEYQAIGAVDRAITPKRRTRIKQATSDLSMDEARQRLYQVTLAIHGVVDQALAESTSEVQRQGLSGWRAELAKSYERLMAGDVSAEAAYNEAVERLTQWATWKPPAKCSHCAAPDQTPGYPCRYCHKTA